MSWITLVPAGLFEIGWAVGLKFTDGFSRPPPSALAILAMLISLGLLGLAMKDLPLGTVMRSGPGLAPLAR
jgi:quaternary ammonium compound-resistance protein SugE